ncbi:MAG TPA: DNA repair protein RecN [Rhizomicrobium sp.]
MLTALTVRDIVLIENATLEFAPGLNVLTGETGAGKSILLDALGLAAGGRGGGRAGVRPGAEQGSAVAVFDPPADHAARAILRDSAMEADSEIILRRVVSGDGRTRAFVNDAPVGVTLLRDLGTALVEVHGQSDDRGLFDNATHRRLLDEFGGNGPLAADVAARFAALEEARVEADALRRNAATAAAEAEYISHSVEELSALGPEEGEEVVLASARALLMNASRIVEDISAALEFLSGDRGAEASLASALKRLSRMNEEARNATAVAATALEQAFASAQDGRAELDSFLSRLELDPHELDKKEERLFALRAAARKYDVQPDALPNLLADFRAKLDALQTGDEKIKAADEAVTTARNAHLATAKKLSAARKSASRELEKAVALELAPLKLGHAQFRVALEPLEDGAATGLERVAFEIATVEGAAFGALTKIASGGELARISLALKVALSGASPPAALVFDEVDRGVGGAVADAVGERLQRLAETTQVLLVTHSPQVAARANRHFRIARVGDKTRVALLTDDEREEEIARMLSGASVTGEARAAAKRLLAEARAPKKTRKRA